MIEDRLRENLDGILSRMTAAERRAGREPGTVQLVAVTKKVEPGVVRRLVGCGAGAMVLGENYPQELWRKAEALADLPVRWHLIGHLQGNKAKATLPRVRMVHGVDSLKLLTTLDAIAEGLDNPPSACLQVNISGEASKHGWSPEELLIDAEAIVEKRSIPIVGLMTIAGYGTTDEEARPAFARLRALRDALRSRTGLALPELSMGMSGDFEAAIAEGSTLVRIGSALFEGVEP